MFALIAKLISPKPAPTTTAVRVIEKPEGWYALGPDEWDEIFLAKDPTCPDCGGKGFGCCVNADIPLPGTDW